MLNVIILLLLFYFNLTISISDVNIFINRLFRFSLLFWAKFVYYKYTIVITKWRKLFVKPNSVRIMYNLGYSQTKNICYY